jgi:predicted Zn-dependent protease
VKDKILETLTSLRTYSREKGYLASLLYHEEDSSLMRFANSAVSLNTREHLFRLSITAYADRKRATFDLVTRLDNLDEMKAGIDIAAEMVQHSQPLTYQPTVPLLGDTFVDDSSCDDTLAKLGGQDKLHFFNSMVHDLETSDLRLSGIFSSGANTVALTNTRSDHALYFQTSDAQITVVLAHANLKWEVIAEQSAQQVSDLDSQDLRRQLAFLVERYQDEPAQQLPLGRYSIVFGPAATAEMLSVLDWIGFDGGLMKRGYSFLTEDQVGQRVFSDRFTLIDDPSRPETFPFRVDLTGIPRQAYSIFQDGIFQGFVWQQDDADEFGKQPTGHTVPHKSLVLQGGHEEIASLDELAGLPRNEDILYIPFLHYMNIVNPSRGIITASSRFGALLLKKDGSLFVPYNVRLTQSLLDIFGDRVEWLSRETIAYNTSQSYGARNPTALIVPKFVKVNDLEISHSNPSY